MKISCIPLSLYPQIISRKISITAWAELGLNAELDGIDLSILFFPEINIKEAANLRSRLDSIDIELCMLNTYSDFTNPNKDKSLIELEKEVHYAEIAEVLGFHFLRVTIGKRHPDISVNEMIDSAIEYLVKLDEKTNNLKTKLLIENHAKPNHWDLDDFSTNIDAFLKIVENIEDTNIGINFDLANATIYSKDPFELLHKLNKKICCIHCSDSSSTEELIHSEIGKGVIPIRRLINELVTMNWDGWISIEEGSNREQIGIMESIKYIRNLLNNCYKNTN